MFGISPVWRPGPAPADMLDDRLVKLHSGCEECARAIRGIMTPLQYENRRLWQFLIYPAVGLLSGLFLFWQLRSVHGPLWLGTVLPLTAVFVTFIAEILYASFAPINRAFIVAAAGRRHLVGPGSDQVRLGGHYVLPMMNVWIELRLVVGDCRPVLRAADGLEHCLRGWSVAMNDPLGEIFFTDPNGWTRSARPEHPKELSKVFSLILGGGSFREDEQKAAQDLDEERTRVTQRFTNISLNLATLLTYLEATKGDTGGPVMGEVRRLTEHLLTNIMAGLPEWVTVRESGDPIRHLVHLRSLLNLKYGLRQTRQRTSKSTS